jgi:phospholipase C
MAIGAGAGALGCLDYGASVSSLPQNSGLDHVVVLILENRSFDHLLGWLPGADGRQAGLTYTDRLGNPYETHHLTDVQGLTDFQGCGFSDPNHSFDGGRVEYNGGACDGWLRADGNDLYAIGYYEADDLAFSGRAAREWTVLDRYFAPIMGPTGPNRFISQAGQTDRIDGSIAISTLPTIWDRLADAGVTGTSYGMFPLNFGDRYRGLIRPAATFIADAAAGALPHVAFLGASVGASDYHPPSDIRGGEAYVASIYQAVTTSPVWGSTLLIITFDEWGGFFDHVPPPPAPIPQIERDAGNLDGLRGFRVPCLLVSPFARRRYVSSTIYDHASILRLIEWRWGLPPLSERDAQANNLAEALDFTRPDVSAPVIDVPTGPFGGSCPG